MDAAGVPSPSGSEATKITSAVEPLDVEPELECETPFTLTPPLVSVPVVMDAPLFRSDPDADPVKVRDADVPPALVYVQVKVAVLPLVMVTPVAGGEVVSVTEAGSAAESALGTTLLAVAWPLFVTCITTSKVPGPVLLAGAVSVPVIAAAVCAITDVLAVNGSAPPVFASVPLPVAPRLRLPAVPTVQFHVIAGLEFAPPAMLWGTPVTAPQVAVAVPLTDGVTVDMLAVDPPVLVIVRVRVRTWPTLTVTGAPPIERLTTIDAGDWTVTDVVAAAADTAAPLLASVPLAEALRLRVPLLEPEQFVYWKFAVAPPAIAWAAGVVPVQAAMAVGVTAFACAVPLFFTASVAVKIWPVFAVVRLAVRVPTRAAAVCTVTEADTLPVEAVAPLLASVPVAVVLSASVPVVADEQFVKEKVALPPPAISCAAGVAPVQAAMAVGVTAFACAPPLFVTFRLAVKT